MDHNELLSLTEKVFVTIEKLIPEYMQHPVDKTISNGNVAAIIIDEAGQVYGRMYGTNLIRVRESYMVAYKKASQVWITGYKTGEFEKKVFNGEIDEYKFGINRPDYIGWIGGQPIVLEDGTKLAVAFSGFRGESDLEIMVRALEMNGVRFRAE